MILPIPVLQALLSPDTEQRRHAEAYLSSLSRADRCRGCVHALLPPTDAAAAAAALPNDLAQLVAVLLRRTVWLLTPTSHYSSTSHNHGTNSVDNNNDNDTLLLQECLTTVLALFLRRPYSDAVQTALGDCLAQIVSVLTKITTDAASPAANHTPHDSGALETVLSAVGPLAQHGDLPSLQLLVRLAEAVPRTFTERAVPSLPSLVTAVLQQSSPSPRILSVLVELIVTARLAATVPSHSRMPLNVWLSSSSSSSLQVSGDYDEEDDPTLTAMSRHLAVTCLQPLLPHLLVPIAASSKEHHDTDEHEEFLDQALQHLMQAAERMPSLLAADASTLEQVVHRCLQLLLHEPPAASWSSSLVQLHALHVVVALLQVPYIKRHLVSPEMRYAVVSTTIPVLVQLLGSRDDADEDDEWASEPAQLHGDSSMDSFYETALYAQELLEGLLIAYPEPVLQRLLPLLEDMLERPAAGATAPTMNVAPPSAALAALSCCVQAAPVTFASHIPVAVKAALEWLHAVTATTSTSLAVAPSASTLRLQYHCLVLLGVTCESGVLGGGGSGGGGSSSSINGDESYHDLVADPRLVWQALARASQSPCTKVASLACAAMVSYARSFPNAASIQKSVLPYVADLLNCLSVPLSLDVEPTVGRIVVKIRALGAVACLAQACGRHFAPYYSAVMPGLLAYAMGGPASSSSSPLAASAHERARLKGAAVQAATMIGQSMVQDEQDQDENGQEDNMESRKLFAPDAQALMQMAVSILQQATSMQEDVVAGMPLDELLTGCARVRR